VPLGNCKEARGMREDQEDEIELQKDSGICVSVKLG